MINRVIDPAGCSSILHRGQSGMRLTTGDDAAGYTPLADVTETHESPAFNNTLLIFMSVALYTGGAIFIRRLCWIDIQGKMTLCQAQGQIMPSDQSEAQNLHSGDGPKDDRGPPLNQPTTGSSQCLVEAIEWSTVGRWQAKHMPREKGEGERI
ncbi:hypothetical protein BO85DRAFT_434145 [Aspergillus piperis CBS 112811]|uniref:Uncharacterized protein n=1 Tax=Aspergillus piperis CBS 112811 TaxID=1448313 RepID=A0A8G1REL9_9EURO|nr:hypothetical protein BO85DRAFT_434145 [Aspergillus piperis CBS 112811]RAH63657.1 hypothetical protein BO85DRAFT_434145 [Aspergillus piperis CBS 112811]